MTAITPAFGSMVCIRWRGWPEDIDGPLIEMQIAIPVLGYIEQRVTQCYCRNQFERSHCAYFKDNECER